MNGMTPQRSLRAADIRVGNATHLKIKALHEPAGALLIDEFSQLQAKLLHANNLFWTVARQHIYDLKLQDYAAPREIAGRVPQFVVRRSPPAPARAGQRILAGSDRRRL